MFGLGFTEVLVLLIVGIVVVGPKKLPVMMRTAGQWITRLRRMSTDLRSQSGIDEIIRAEGLEKEIRELKSLSRINVMDSLVNATAARPAPRSLTARATAGGAAQTSTAPAAATSPTASALPATSPTASAVPATSDGPAPASPTTEMASPATEKAEASAPTIVKPPGAPPPGAVAGRSPFAAGSAGLGARRAVVVLPLVGEEPLPDREWPVIGCDAYDALPDDLDEEEAAAAALAGSVEPTGQVASPEAGASPAAVVESAPASESPIAETGAA